MNKTVVLELKGNLDQQGFYVTLHIAQDGTSFNITEDGFLPACPALLASLTQWQENYHRLAFPTRALRPYKLKFDGKIHPLDICSEASQQLARQFAYWLRADSFREIELRLRQTLTPSDLIQVLIRTSNTQLQSLPWHLWDFIECYPRAEIAFSGLRSHTLLCEYSSPRSARTEVKILAILGDRHNIDVDHDRHLLSQLPNVHIEFLVEPTHQALHDYLYEQSWNILFFAGHSATEVDGEGLIRLNSEAHLTVPEVSYAVRRAIANGLQLAIFNSCDGLGLAQALADLQLPHLIVMREAIPDAVAQLFLKFFLQAFAQGHPLHLAVREARERLQSIERQYPCASWLPVLYQHQVGLPLTWQGLRDVLRSLSPPAIDGTQKLAWETAFSLWSRTTQRTIAISLLSTLLVMGVRWTGVLQLWELQQYDQFLRWRSMELPDPRILLVGVDEADLRTYRHPLSDDVLSRVISTVAQAQPRAIGLDIYRDQPVPPHSKSLLSTIKATPNLTAICAFGSTEMEAIAPLPQMPLEQLGFADLEKDDLTFTVRRHLLSHQLSSPSLCNTDYSFVLQLLFHYIDGSDGRFSINVTPKMDWQITDAVRQRSITLKRLASRSGGYQALDARGNQILINYRMTPTIAQQVSVDDLLRGAIDDSWIKNRVVLIGVVAPSIQDDHNTSLGQLRGLEVHAHMLSQLLSAIEDQRPLVHWLPQWADLLFSFLWALAGGVVILKLQSTQFSNQRKSIILICVAIGTGISLIYFSSWLMLSRYGLWLPVVPASLTLLTMSCFVILQVQNRLTVNG